MFSTVCASYFIWIIVFGCAWANGAGYWSWQRGVTLSKCDKLEMGKVKSKYHRRYGSGIVSRCSFQEEEERTGWRKREETAWTTGLLPADLTAIALFFIGDLTLMIHQLFSLSINVLIVTPNNIIAIWLENVRKLRRESCGDALKCQEEENKQENQSYPETLRIPWNPFIRYWNRCSVMNKSGDKRSVVVSYDLCSQWSSAADAWTGFIEQPVTPSQWACCWRQSFLEFRGTKGNLVLIRS